MVKCNKCRWRQYIRILERAAAHYGLDTHGEGTPAYQAFQQRVLWAYLNTAPQTEG